MRKHQQKQILDVLKTIEQAQSAKLYGDCQEGALSLCDFIESIEGDESSKSEVVALLVDYCELLFKANNGEIGEKILRKHLIKVENCVTHKLKPNKIEMVFISYKAAMCDSLETIYLAAKADPNCDAYWIPIPYIERNAGGVGGITIYEDAEHYPSYIECTDWQTYDIETRHPDAIFTFAPYDGNNYVTSVHPDFYCEQLHKLTDMLVYVPYFVSADSEVSGHFTTLSGCIFAHKVIVESERVRLGYISDFKKTYGNKFGNVEEKFVALGSPKYDKVVTMQKENYVLPVDWMQHVSNRKVILYLTSITAILQCGEQHLEKVRFTIDLFSNRDDVVMWWRPHPLSEATYNSMRPQLAVEYKELVDYYKNSNIGIYDDSADLHRAIAYSDVYYGDGSSVLRLYLATGKPILYQNTGVIQSLNQNHFEAYDDGYYIWILFDLNIYDMLHIYKYDKKSGDTSRIGHVTKNTSLSKWLEDEMRVSIDTLVSVSDIGYHLYFTKKINAINCPSDCTHIEAPFATLENFINYMFSDNYATNMMNVSDKQKFTLGLDNTEGSSGSIIYAFIRKELNNV